MKRTLNALLAGIIITTLLSSCNEEENTDPVINSELQEYVDQFVTEAEERGVEISLDNLVVQFGSLEELCGFGRSSPPVVTIDPDCWVGLPSVPKEILMYHELGHALLGRSHTSEKLPNGDWASMMYEDPTILYNEYTIEKRAYYSDELFRTIDEMPYWTTAKENETIIIRDDLSSIGSWNYAVVNADHSGELVDSTFASAPNSLMINSNSVGSGFSYWAYSWVPEDITTGSELLLRVKMRAQSLTGGGAFFVLRADIDEWEYPIFFYTTQNDPLVGNADWNFDEYSIKVNYYPSRVDRLNIFLMLDGNSDGTVFFDDIEVIELK